MSLKINSKKDTAIKDTKYIYMDIVYVIMLWRRLFLYRKEHIKMCRHGNTFLSMGLLLNIVSKKICKYTNIDLLDISNEIIYFQFGYQNILLDIEKQRHSYSSYFRNYCKIALPRVYTKRKSHYLSIQIQN